MKSVLILGLVWSLYGHVFAQTYIFDFDNPMPSDSVLIIDTVNFPNNVWQVGKSEKPFFHAFDSTTLLATDTLSSYPANNYSAFVLRLPYFVNEYAAVSLSFWHTFQTDSLHDGGYIEFLDVDSQWYNIGPATGFNYGPGPVNPIIGNGEPAFTGTAHTNEVFDLFCVPYFTDGHVYLRFVFYSDSIQENLDGWAIRELIVQYTICEGVERDRSEPIGAFPNPAEDFITVKSASTAANAVCTIADLTGRTILSQPCSDNQRIDVSAIPPGIYFLIFSDDSYRAVKPLTIAR